LCTSESGRCSAQCGRDWILTATSAAVIFPCLGPVHFFATAVEAPTPNPIEPIVGAGSVILVSGEDHRRKRRLLMPALHGSGTRARASATWRPGDRIALSAAARSIALRIIVFAMFGVENADRYDELADVVTGLMNANSAALMLLPVLRRRFVGLGPLARLVRLRARFDDLLSEQIPATGVDDGSELAALLAGNTSARLDPGDLHQQLRTLVVAGHDTTAGALMWTLYHIHREPGVRDRILAELDAATTPDSLPELPYLSAVVSEALRMHPAVPIVLRRLTAPLRVAGVQWPAGAVVGVAVPAMHFAPQRWPHPYRFDPDRFLGRPPTPFEYLPFGGGFRRCPAVSAARNRRDRYRAASRWCRGGRYDWMSTVDGESATGRGEPEPGVPIARPAPANLRSIAVGGSVAPSAVADPHRRCPCVQRAIGLAAA
jgi:cytochrome P450